MCWITGSVVRVQAPTVAGYIISYCCCVFWHQPDLLNLLLDNFNSQPVGQGLGYRVSGACSIPDSGRDILFPSLAALGSTRSVTLAALGSTRSVKLAALGSTRSVKPAALGSISHPSVTTRLFFGVQSEIM